MTSRPRQQRYCRCGTHLAKDNSGRQCARCERISRDKLIAPPEVPPEFWQTEQFREAFAARHMGRVSRAYRTHTHHYAVYGLDGISQTLLGQWLGLRQPQISRFENGPPLQHLDTLQHWARILRIPADRHGDARSGHGAFCTATYIELQRADCWLQLNQPQRSVTAYETALTGLPGAYNRDRGYGLAQFGSALIAINELEHAVSVTREALVIAQGCGSGRTLQRIRVVGSSLRPHAKLPAVARLLDELAAAG